MALLNNPHELELEDKKRMDELKKKLKNPLKKTSFPIPEDIHIKLKLKSMETGIEMRDLILEAVRKSLE